MLSFVSRAAARIGYRDALFLGFPTKTNFVLDNGLTNELLLANLNT